MLTIQKNTDRVISVQCFYRGARPLSAEPFVIIAGGIYPVCLLDGLLVSCAYWALKGLHRREENVFGALDVITEDWFYVSHNPVGYLPG